ncbi:MAG TPA: ankyrin repeat domain-containing protein, partial [Polyangiaceae bacterium]|nr:ankyrin repeat domain-containing protein [Polyangiaceae bacterium]
MARRPPEPSDPRAAALEGLKNNGLAPKPEALAEHLAGHRVDLVDAFLTLGVAPDGREASPPRRTALMLALLQGRVGVAGRLLDAGADPALRDDHGFTAMCWAAIGAGLWLWTPELAALCERMAGAAGVGADDRALAAAMGDRYAAFARLLRRWCEMRRPERVARMRPAASPAQ